MVLSIICAMVVFRLDSFNRSSSSPSLSAIVTG